MNIEMIKKIEIDEYLAKLKKDYIIDPTCDVSYLILKDNTVTISIIDDNIIADNITKESIIDDIESIIKK